MLFQPLADIGAQRDDREALCRGAFDGSSNELSGEPATTEPVGHLRVEEDEPVILDAIDELRDVALQIDDEPLVHRLVDDKDAAADAAHRVVRQLGPHGVAHLAHLSKISSWLPPTATLTSGAVGCSATARVSYDQQVAYDERLAERIRELVEGEPGLAEKKMFGGLAFLVGGNMAVAASSQGGIMVRVEPAQSEMLVATTKASLVEMRGRQMRGWLRVAGEDVDTRRQLGKWVELGMTYARSLPSKQ